MNGWRLRQRLTSAHAQVVNELSKQCHCRSHHSVHSLKIPRSWYTLKFQFPQKWRNGQRKCLGHHGTLTGSRQRPLRRYQPNLNGSVTSKFKKTWAPQLSKYSFLHSNETNTSDGGLLLSGPKIIYFVFFVFMFTKLSHDHSTTFLIAHW